MFCILERTLKAIADAIRAKTGKTDMLDPADFATEIDNISGEIPEGYIKPEGRKLIVTNGVHDVAAYEEVNVSVGDNEIETSNNTLKLFLGDTFTYEYNNSIEFVVNPTGLVKCNQSKGVATFTTIGVGSCNMTITERNATGDAIKINNYYITVEQKAESAKLKEHTATTNGVYLPPNGYDGFSKFTVNVPSEEIPVITYTYDIRLGDTFSIDYEEQTSPYVEMSNTKTLSYHVDGGTIEFTAIGLGECTVELQSPNITDDGDYVVIARANIIVRAQDVPEVAPSYVTELKVGDVFYLDYENSSPDVYVSNSKVISYYVDSGEVKFTAIHVGDCIVELRRSRGGDEYDVLAKAIVTVLDAENVPVYSYAIKKGDEFSLDYEGESPDVNLSDKNVLSHYDKDGVIKFIGIGVGYAVVEIKKTNGITIAKANVTVEEADEVFKYILAVGEEKYTDVPVDGGLEYWLDPSGFVELNDDFDYWSIKAIKAGECTIKIGLDPDMPDYEFKVKVVGEAVNAPVYSYDLKVGEKFSLEHDYANPVIHVSNSRILSYRDYGNTIEFTAVEVGEGVVELKNSNGITIAKANITVTRETEKPTPEYTLNVKVGEEFDVNTVGSNINVWMSNKNIISYYDDGGCINFTAIGVGECLIEVQTPLTEDGDYDVIARMYVTVEEADEAFDYIVAVGETINLDVPTDGFEAWTSPNGIVEMDDDFDHWSAKAISAGVCLIKIGLDPDMPDYEYKVKVVGTAIEEYDGTITIS